VLEYEDGDFINAALTYSVEQYVAFEEKVIQSSNRTLASIPAGISRRRFLMFVLGKELFGYLVSLSKSAPRSTLVTLDGIDSASVDYRLEFLRFHDTPHEDSLRRARAEIDLVKSLMRMISAVKATPREFEFLSSCDFCVTIPLDIYQETHGYHERDSYRCLSSCRTLDWTGPELAVMLRKRLELLMGRRVDKEKFYHPEQRLNEALEDFYPGLPKEIPVEAAGKVTSYPLLLYILRHCFWRPREVIFHFVGLISSFEYFSNSAPLGPLDVKAIVSDQARALISIEFVDEFKTSILNIDEIIGKCRLGPQFLSWQEFLQILNGIEFVFYTSDRKAGSYPPLKKARLLDEIGFVGIRMTDEQMKGYSRPRDIFSFSEGVQILVRWKRKDSTTRTRR
jgi:hypothetical protein